MIEREEKWGRMKQGKGVKGQGELIDLRVFLDVTRPEQEKAKTNIFQKRIIYKEEEGWNEWMCMNRKRE